VGCDLRGGEPAEATRMSGGGHIGAKQAAPDRAPL
jgi:hypothetical protein